MDWEAIAAVGQMLGSIAVFVSIGYLALQVRHARTEVTRSVLESRAAATRETTQLFLEQPDLRQVLLKTATALDVPIDPPVQAFMDRAGLDRDEAEVVTSWCLRQYAAQVGSIEYADQMTVRDRQWSDARLRRQYGSGIGAVWYEAVKFRLPGHVVRYIDDLLAKRR